MRRIFKSDQRPFEVKPQQESVWICMCGLSKNQPFCDGSHKDTGLTPMAFIAEKTEEVWLCGCKSTGGKPFCDGTHNSL